MSHEGKSLIQWASELAHDRLIESYWRRAAIDEMLQSSVGKRREMPMLPEPMPHHDGWLDDGSASWMATKVEYDLSYKVHHLSIHGGYGDMESRDITLDPKQALSLLAWLQQEKATLERLAKERAE